MDTTNMILLISGVFVLIIGILAFIYPGLTRWINAPGGPQLKSIIAIIIGILIILFGFII